MIQLTVRSKKTLLWDTIVLSKDMFLELIDNNPDKLKEIIEDLHVKNTGGTEIEIDPSKLPQQPTT